MILKKHSNSEELVIYIKGDLDSSTSNELLDYFNENYSNQNIIIFDFSECGYVSSAGVRVLLLINKSFDKNKITIKLRKANDTNKRIFEIAGLSDYFVIEK